MMLYEDIEKYKSLSISQRLQFATTIYKTYLTEDAVLQVKPNLLISKKIGKSDTKNVQ